MAEQAKFPSLATLPTDAQRDQTCCTSLSDNRAPSLVESRAPLGSAADMATREILLLSTPPTALLASLQSGVLFYGFD